MSKRFSNDGYIKRVRVYQYNKSGKLTAIYSNGRHMGYTAIDLTPELNRILAVRNPKYVKEDAFSRTGYHAEFKVSVVKKTGNYVEQAFFLLRVLTAEDLDENRWKTTEDLNDLPVSPHPDLTQEERLWAGERSGNVGGGVLLGAVALGCSGFAINTYMNDGEYLFLAGVALVFGFFLARYRWKLPKRAIPSRVDALKHHKRLLKESAKQNNLKNRTAFEAALEDFETWKSLSPQEFEMALSLKLENEGYKVEATKYSGDGGVDIEAEDTDGNPIIVQAKHYNSNVGVAVVREMIGVRESRSDAPHTVVFSLVGFTRGAKELAVQEGIELRDIKTELLGV